ncbi:hypothetical protein [Gottfriedia solisilvae]|nr:hypothetical protein [Gottfriedia solisilvae]
MPPFFIPSLSVFEMAYKYNQKALRIYFQSLNSLYLLIDSPNVQISFKNEKVYIYHAQKIRARMLFNEINNVKMQVKTSILIANIGGTS